tara:strand:- start:503 stop:1129 length:627 start_codon:yes stop_codon:yes gene_type:complete
LHHYIGEQRANSKLENNMGARWLKLGMAVMLLCLPFHAAHAQMSQDAIDAMMKQAQEIQQNNQQNNTMVQQLMDAVGKGENPLSAMMDKEVPIGQYTEMVSDCDDRTFMACTPDYTCTATDTNGANSLRIVGKVDGKCRIKMQQSEGYNADCLYSQSTMQKMMEMRHRKTIKIRESMELAQLVGRECKMTDAQGKPVTFGGMPHDMGQ